MPDPRDPTPVRVVKRGDKFVVVDADGKMLPGEEPTGDSSKAAGVAARINASWKDAKSARKAKGGPEITEAWSPASRVAAAIARRRDAGPHTIAGAQLRPGQQFVHQGTPYVAHSVAPHPEGGVRVVAHPVSGGPAKNLHFERHEDVRRKAGFRPESNAESGAFQRRHLVTVQEARSGLQQATVLERIVGLALEEVGND